MGRRRPLTLLDWSLIASWPFAALVIVVAALSIPVEETHEIGNDAPLDRLMIGVCVAWIVMTALLVLLRRAPGGLRAQFRRERQHWREMRAAERSDGSD